MAIDVPLRCSCGKLQGTGLGLSRKSGFRVVCFCNDCQAFARFLGRSDITDARGGTELFQTAPSRLRLTAGADALCCVRLSAKGMHRWYCGECKTPVGNTLGPRLPFVGMVRSFIDWASAGSSPDAALGEPAVYGFPDAALGGPPPEARNKSEPWYIARIVSSLGKWWLTGAGQPSPFFDAKTRAPRASVQILTAEERRALR
jgi:hypothetical protein